MANSEEDFLIQIGQAWRGWFHQRVSEAVHCHQCDEKVDPFTPYCPNCGESSPAKVAWSAPACLGVALASLAAIGVGCIWLF